MSHDMQVMIAYESEIAALKQTVQKLTEENGHNNKIINDIIPNQSAIIQQAKEALTNALSRAEGEVSKQIIREDLIALEEASK